MGGIPVGGDVHRRAGVLTEGAAVESLVRTTHASGQTLTNQPQPHFLAAPGAGSGNALALRDLAANQSPH